MKHSLKLVLAGIALLAVSGVAHAETGKMYIPPKAAANAAYKDVVRDSNGNPVHATNGTCVRTNWSAKCDACAAQPEPAPQVMIPLEDRTVYFDLNKSTLTPVAKKKLTDLVDTMRKMGPVKTVRIAGYADRLGTPVYNEKLSKKRADAVRKYLAAEGVTNAQIVETRWFGETVPATKCPKDMKRKELIVCLQKDRRVEVEVEFGLPGTYILPKAVKAPHHVKGAKKKHHSAPKAKDKHEPKAMDENKAVDKAKTKAKPAVKE
ncbi:MAG: OmpA family protein [Alphaproteobacteria bacterium]|nr:OmpA family protein [Alphaproteobacteria bacterium]